MAIGFARLEFVKRSDGKNACCKAAYNSRSIIHFKGHEFSKETVFDWSHKLQCAFHEIIVPDHVDKTFKSPDVLWNAVELKENRINSQLCMDLVLALPDDKVVSPEDKMELARTFIQKNFVDKGLAAQIDVHPPEKFIHLSPELGEIEDFNHNWHAHVLITTRRFKENGRELSDDKARDLMPDVRSIGVVNANKWGRLWGEHQNQFFEGRGLALRVDPNGLTVQIHLGPVRMRGRAFDLLQENNLRMELNQEEAKDPAKLLKAITDYKNIFSSDDLVQLLDKFVDTRFKEIVKSTFWNQQEIVSLVDSSGNHSGKFSTKEILAEEKKCFSLADSIHSKQALKIDPDNNFGQYGIGLSGEQKTALNNIIEGQRLSCIGGYAGTGKSYLLIALKNVYENEGYNVRAFGPDAATAKVLKDKGFLTAETLHSFLFHLHNKKKTIQRGKEIWIIDEAGKLGNRPIAQILKYAADYDIQVIFSGDRSQLTPVERGFMYNALCERYGSQDLHEIRRQEKEHDRAISKKIAKGEISSAIDDIIRAGGIVWGEKREDCIEKLIKCWAADKEAFSDESSIIIAHSNAERKTLNEMVRLYRKSKGELGEEEFRCAIDKQVIYVSKGDVIEFRKNDKVIGVDNGMSGVLVEASPEKFIVAVKEGKKIRHVEFDPREHTSFQLGYATTYNRSQGETVRRAYVLQSPRMNKESFYVGLTRHVQKAYLFVPKDSLHYLSYLKIKSSGYKGNFCYYLDENGHFQSKTLDQYTLELKAQFTQGSIKETTHDYQTSKEVDLQALKNSNSILSKAKGHALSSWDQFTGYFSQQYYSKKADHEFFNTNLKKDQKAEITSIILNQPGLNKGEEYLRQDFEEKELNLDGKTIVSSILSTNVESEIANTNLFLDSKKSDMSQKQVRNGLSQEDQNLLKNYFASNEKVSTLKILVDIEIENGLEKRETSEHFVKLMETGSIRNVAAHRIVKNIPKNKLQCVFGNQGFDVLIAHSNKHEKALQRFENKKIDYDSELKENLEVLLYKLFPEGPTSRDRNGFRFGSKGSLYIKGNGNKIGIFYDHENKIGGGPLKLIQKVLGLTPEESQKWAKDFLGGSQQLKIPSHFAISKRFNKEIEWVSCLPNSKDPAPALQELCSGLDKNFKEVSRHPYVDQSGNLLFYILRLIDKNNPSQKSILPLSYGHAVGDNLFKWSLKGYRAEKKPLYNLPQIQMNRLATILIVEGEKTADAANKLFSKENMVCVTWCGGATNVSKADWMPLHNKEIVIWPDNDPAGYKAADDICFELRKIGVTSLRVVDKEILAKEFPAKWDLADSVPNGKSKAILTDLILTAKEKSIGMGQLCLGIKTEDSLIEKLRANEILWRVEERLRPILEEKYGSKFWEIKNEIQNETLKILSSADRLEKEMMNSGLGGEIGKRLTYQSLVHQASTGKLPSTCTINEMKQVLADFGSIHKVCQKTRIVDDINLNREINEYALDKALSVVFCYGTYGKDVHKQIEAAFQPTKIAQQIAYETDLKKTNDLTKRNHGQLSRDLK